MAAVAPSAAALALSHRPRARHRRVTTRASPISVRSTAAASSLVAPVPDSNFGRVVDGPALLSLPHAERRAVLREALERGSGLVLVPNLANISPRTLVELSYAVGDVVEKNPGVAPEYLIPNVPEVQVIGNVRDERGALRAMFSRAPPCPPTAHGRTDAAVRSGAEIARVAHGPGVPGPTPVRQFALLREIARPAPGRHPFADMTAACNALDTNRREELRKLRAVCSYARHNAKVNERTPTYRLLTPNQAITPARVAANHSRRPDTNTQNPCTSSAARCAL